ncbi:MAG: rhodanese-like domain-containing protein [Sandaracinaceae bacterium]
MRVQLTVVGLSALLLACGGAEISVTGHDPVPDPHRVSGQQAMRLVLNGALLVDVSDRIEYYGRHVQGAFNIPWDELEERTHEIPRDRPVIVYSRDGRHAAESDLFLRSRGFDVHLLGRFENWGS